MINEKQSNIYIVFVGVLIFFVGFVFGKSSTPKMPNIAILNATTTESIDLLPFWKAWTILEEKFTPSASTTKPISIDDKLWGMISGLTSSYNDPYTVFFPPSESKTFEEEIAGSFGGVGMEIGIEKGLLKVVAPLKGSPAERVGVLPGDIVIMINDKPAINMTTEEAIRLIRGEVGSIVSITFKREGINESIKKDIVRDIIEIPTISTKITKENVFVIELYSFSATSPGLFREALRKFIEANTDKLVIDLRNNPGGYLEASLDMASWFLPVGKVVVTEDFGGKRETISYKSKGYDIFTDQLKLAILVNEGSASASEILAGALREHKKAILIGENTFGKGSVQELEKITDDTSLKITVAHWLTPNGNSLSNGGLKPDIEVKLTKENTKNGNDPVLSEAIKYLLNK